MAVYNEIGIGRWNRFIQKITDIKGGPPARQLSSEIVFQHPIFHGTENRYLESWGRFAIAANAGAGGVGNRSGAMIRNASGSNVIAVLERITPTSTGVSDAPNLTYVLASGSTLANPGTVVTVNSALDNRGPVATPTSNVIVSTNAGSILGVTIALGVFPAFGSFDFITTDMNEMPLAPGSAYVVYANTLNLGVIVNFQWRERFLEPSERF